LSMDGPVGTTRRGPNGYQRTGGALRVSIAAAFIHPGDIGASMPPLESNSVQCGPTASVLGCRGDVLAAAGSGRCEGKPGVFAAATAGAATGSCRNKTSRR
jgi:hypothetical protein